MKFNVCKEITSVYLNDKSIASLQPNVSPARCPQREPARRLYASTLTDMWFEIGPAPRFSKGLEKEAFTKLNANHSHSERLNTLNS